MKRHLIDTQGRLQRSRSDIRVTFLKQWVFRGHSQTHFFWGVEGLILASGAVQALVILFSEQFLTNKVGKKKKNMNKCIAEIQELGRI